MQFLGEHANAGRALGTALIALGAFLPGIGGAMTKVDQVEWLYVGEFAGLLLIVVGYVICIRAPSPQAGLSAAVEAG